MAETSRTEEARWLVDSSYLMPELSDSTTHTAPLPVLRWDSTYFDTPDLRLLRMGFTLCRRRDRLAGDASVWTLTLPPSTVASLDVAERRWPGMLTTVPLGAQSLLRGIVRRSDLVAVATLRTTRRRIELRTPTGNRVGEVGDDQVAVVQGTRQGLRFRELEVGLDPHLDVDAHRPGHDLVRAVTARLVGSGAKPRTRTPTLSRALGIESLSPFAGVALDADATIRDLVRAHLASGLCRLLAHDPGLRARGHDVEHVHQARVSARRLRSGLNTLSPLLEPTWSNQVRRELKWLGAVLGIVRDADVLGLWLDTLTESAHELDQSHLRAMRFALGGERSRAAESLLDAIASDRYLDLVDAVADAVADPPLRSDPAFPPTDAAPGHASPSAKRRRLEPIEPSSLAGPVASTILARPQKRLRRAARAVASAPTDVHLHQLRIRAKELRYTAEMLVPVCGKRTGRLADDARALQGILGDLHDALGAEAWLRCAASESPDWAFVAGQAVTLARQRQAKARVRWRRSWHALERRIRHS